MPHASSTRTFHSHCTGGIIVSDLKTGGAFVLLAAIANSGFAVPMKWMPRWSWENIWLVWSVGALLVFPLLAAYLTVPQLFAGYAEVAPDIVARVIFFGFAWGIAQVLFGLSVDKIGMALTFSIVLGTSAAVGTIVPFALLHPELLLTAVGGFVIAGIVCVSAGMILCARAGFGRERETAGAINSRQNGPFRGGLILAFVSGFCASFMNLGISFAAPLLQMAARHGAKPYWSLNAVWLPLLIGGAIPNLYYCVHLFAKRRSFPAFAKRSTSAYWFFCALMAALWFGSSLAYGVASFNLGTLGPIVGWPVFMSLIVICASIFGWVSGEWRTTTRRPLQLHLAGIAFLVLALFFLSRVSS
jgi:L-rhamnose-H+ transport protein